MAMKKKAPHLPAPACRVDTYYRLQNVKWLLLFAGLAFIAGVSAALIVAAWVLPNTNTGQYIQTINLDREVNQATPEPLLVRQTKQRLLTIYDSRQKPTKELYTTQAWLGQAAIISSDGWAVAYLPNYINGLERYWEILDYQGVEHAIEKLVYDKLEGLIYFKVAAEGLRVVSFPDWSDLGQGSLLWSVSFTGWDQEFIQTEIKNSPKDLITAWQPAFNFQLLDDVAVGELLFNNQGQFVGMALEANLLSHGWLVEKQIAPLLETGQLSYLGLPWQGYFVYGINDNLAGFYIEKSFSALTANSVLRGDVVLEINGEMVAGPRWAEQIWLAPEEFSIVVWRAGVEQEISVNKERVMP